MRHIFDHVVESGHFVSCSVRRRLQFYLISLPPSKVCPQCETIVALRLKVCYYSLSRTGFCRFPYTFRYVFVNACALSDHRARAKASTSTPKYLGLHFSAFSFEMAVFWK